MNRRNFFSFLPALAASLASLPWVGRFIKPVWTQLPEAAPDHGAVSGVVEGAVDVYVGDFCTLDVIDLSPPGLDGVRYLLHYEEGGQIFRETVTVTDQYIQEAMHGPCWRDGQLWPAVSRDDVIAHQIARRVQQMERDILHARSERWRETAHAFDRPRLTDRMEFHTIEDRRRYWNENTQARSPVA